MKQLITLLLSILRLIYRFCIPSPPNPFKQDTRKPRNSYVHNHKNRNKVLKQDFSIDKVPKNVDAVVIGSGIGGLATAVILAKAGKKVVVLEQGSRAGGCCGTFIYQDVEMDAGVHYVGEMSPGTIHRTLFDQITDGQLEWEQLDKEFDVVTIGRKDKIRKYPVTTGVEEWKKLLKKQFPNETVGIEAFFTNVETCRNGLKVLGILKMLPLWIVGVLIYTRALRLITNLWTAPMTTSSLKMIKKFTQNSDLRTVLTYNWGNIGTLPSESYFSNPASMCLHYMSHGAFYPVGGASEIPFTMIPIIEKSGGSVLVNARVKEIFFTKGKVGGVHVQHNEENFVIPCTTVISSAGLYNTIMKMVPRKIATKSYFYDIVNTELNKPPFTMISCNAVLNGTAKELGLKKQNVFAYSDSHYSDQAERDYLDAKIENVMEMDYTKIPGVFISFNSVKNPEWDKEGEDITVMQVIAPANWDWFKQWEGLEDKGEEYKKIKDSLGQKLIDKSLEIFPQLKDRIIYNNITTPLTYSHFLGKHQGAPYGLEHSMKRYTPWMEARLRAGTDLPGLYLAGQDITTSGVVYSCFSGVLAAQSVLGRPVVWDLYNLHTSLENKKK